MISNYILACVNFWKMAVYICTYCPDDRTDVIIRLGCHVRVITGLWLLVRDKNKHALTRLYLFTRSKPGQHV